MTITNPNSLNKPQIPNVAALRFLKKILELNELENQICAMFNSDETQLSFINDDLIDIFVELAGIDEMDDKGIDKFYDELFSISDLSFDNLQVFLNKYIPDKNDRF